MKCVAQIVLSLSLIAIGVGPCLAQPSFNPQTPAAAKKILERAARHPKPGVVNETAEMTRRDCNIDYYQAVRGVIAKNPEAISTMFRCAKCVDGAAGEAYSFDINAVLDYLGDQFFAEQLKKAPTDVRTAVIDAVTWAFGISGGDKKLFRRLYPQTYKVSPKEFNAHLMERNPLGERNSPPD